MWISNNTKPEVGGYYLTYYFNEEQNAMMFKAFWYRPEQDKWLFRFDPDVKAWWNSRYDFYVPCQMQENVDDIPEELRVSNPNMK